MFSKKEIYIIFCNYTYLFLVLKKIYTSFGITSNFKILHGVYACML